MPMAKPIQHQSTLSIIVSVIVLCNLTFALPDIFAGVSFGKGSYFATTAQYSLQYARDFMILAKVATGRYYKGSSAVDRTKLRPGYHSTVNDEANPSIFVVYHDAAAYPEYVLNLSRY